MKTTYKLIAPVILCFVGFDPSMADDHSLFKAYTVKWDPSKHSKDRFSAYQELQKYRAGSMAAHDYYYRFMTAVMGHNFTQQADEDNCGIDENKFPVPMNIMAVASMAVTHSDVSGNPASDGFKETPFLALGSGVNPTITGDALNWNRKNFVIPGNGSGDGIIPLCTVKPSSEFPFAWVRYEGTPTDGSGERYLVTLNDLEVRASTIPPETALNVFAGLVKAVMPLMSGAAAVDATAIANAAAALAGYKASLPNGNGHPFPLGFYDIPAADTATGPVVRVSIAKVKESESDEDDTIVADEKSGYWELFVQRKASFLLDTFGTSGPSSRPEYIVTAPLDPVAGGGRPYFNFINKFPSYNLNNPDENKKPDFSKFDPNNASTFQNVRQFCSNLESVLNVCSQGSAQTQKSSPAATPTNSSQPGGATASGGNMCLSTIDALLVKWGMLYKYGINRAINKVSECWSKEDEAIFTAVMPKKYLPTGKDFPGN